MAIHNSISKKIESAHSEIRAKMNESSGALDIESCAKIYLQHIDIDQFAFHIPSTDKFETNVVYAAISLLKSKSVGAHFSNTIITLGRGTEVYNTIVQCIDTSKDEDIINEVLLENLRSFVMANGVNISNLVFPIWPKHAPVLFDNLIASGVDHLSLLSNMNAIEIAAAAPALIKFGFKALPADTVITYPMEPFGRFDYDQMIPLFETLSQIHGAYKSQIMLENLFMDKNNDKRYVFISPDDIKPYIGDCPVTYIEEASKNFNHLKAVINKVVGAHRNAGKLELLDSLTKKTSKKLIEDGILQIADLDFMPETARHHSRAKLEFDMGML
jgi:hypothetical protein